MKKLLGNKKFVLLASIIAIMAVTVGGTMAYIQAGTGSLINRFSSGIIKTEIVEENTVGQKVARVVNTGSADCLVRVRIENSTDMKITEVIISEDEDGNPYWTKDGEYYYYNPILKCTDSDTKNATAALTIKYEFPSDYTDSDIENSSISVYEESIQTNVGGVTDRKTLWNSYEGDVTGTKE